MSFALAHRGTGVLQPRIAVQGAVSAAGTSLVSWTDSTPGYSLQFASLSVGGELVSRDHRETLAISPGFAVVRWTRGPAGDFIPSPAYSSNVVVPSISIDGTLHVPLIAGLDLEPGLSFFASAPIHVSGIEEGSLLQVQARIGLGF